MFNRTILYLSFSLFIFSLSIYTGEQNMTPTQEKMPSKEEAIWVIATHAQYNPINEKHLNNPATFNESIYLDKTLKKPRAEIESDFNTLHTSYETYKTTPPKVLINFILQKMTLATEALYLVSTTEDDFAKNRQLAKTLSLKYHPDKTTDEQERQLATNLITFLLNNTTSAHLSNLINDTHEKTIDIIKRPSVTKTINTVATGLILCPTAEVVGYNIIANLLPNKQLENRYYQKCIKEAQRGALLIETELLKFPNKR